VVMARMDVSSMSLVAFHKKDGDRQWERCPESIPIPQGIMPPDYTIPGCVILLEETSAPPTCSGNAMATGVMATTVPLPSNTQLPLRSQISNILISHQ
jgi:hypothetical protein